jgi:SAM-dependent methyltransferase
MEIKLMAETAAITPDIGVLKSKMKATWSSGDFGKIADVIQGGATEFVDRLNLKPGETVLDVACGTGNSAIPAARKGSVVTGVDIAVNLLEQARARAEAEGVEATFEEGDAEALPCADGSFDTVTTMFGAMFAPRPDKTSAELIRVCRPGGRIVMANWTPSGFIGQMFKTTGKHITPPSIPSPLLWGDEETANKRFSEGISEVKMVRTPIPFVLPFPPDEVVDFFREFYGPTKSSFAALDADGQEALKKDLTDLWRSHNRATDGTTKVDSEYLEVTAIRA